MNRNQHVFKRLLAGFLCTVMVFGQNTQLIQANSADDSSISSTQSDPTPHPDEDLPPSDEQEPQISENSRPEDEQTSLDAQQSPTEVQPDEPNSPTPEMKPPAKVPSSPEVSDDLAIEAVWDPAGENISFDSEIVPRMELVNPDYGVASKLYTLRITARFPEGTNKKLSISLAPGMVWQNNGADGFPEGTLLALSERTGATSMEEYGRGYVLEDGTYTYEFGDIAVTTVKISVGMDPSLMIPSIKNPVRITASCTNPSGNEETTEQTLKQVDIQRKELNRFDREMKVRAETDKDVAAGGLTLNTVNSYYNGIHLSVSYNRVEYRLRVPAGIEITGMKPLWLNVANASLENWTISDPEVDEATGEWIYTVSMEKYRGYYLGICPIIRIPSETYHQGDQVDVKVDSLRVKFFNPEFNDDPETGWETIEPNQNEKKPGVFHFVVDEEEEVFVNSSIPKDAIHPSVTTTVLNDDPGMNDAVMVNEFQVGNRGATDSKPKVVEFEFDPDVIRPALVRIPIPHGQSVTTIYYRLKDDPTWYEASISGETQQGQDLYNRGITLAMLGLDESAALAGLKYHLDFEDEDGNRWGIRTNTYRTSYIYGYLENFGPDHPQAVSSIRIYDLYDEDDQGNPLHDTEKGMLYSQYTGKNQVYPYLNAESFHKTDRGIQTVNAGETLRFHGRLSTWQASNKNSKEGASQTPTIYIRDETGLGISNVRLVNGDGENIFNYGATLKKADWKDNTGCDVWIIDTTPVAESEHPNAAAIGYWKIGYDNRIQTNLDVYWDVKTPNEYNDHESHHMMVNSLFWSDPDITEMRTPNGECGQNNDPFDVDHDGLVGTDDNMAQDDNGNQQAYVIIPRTDITVKTMAKHVNASDFVEWDGSEAGYIQVGNGSGFQLKTTIINRSGQDGSTDEEKKSYFYIPIPKEGDQWGILNQGRNSETETNQTTFPFSTVLLDEIHNPDPAVFRITYGHVDLSGLNENSTKEESGRLCRNSAFGAFSDNDKESYNCIRIEVSGLKKDQSTDFVANLKVISYQGAEKEGDVDIFAPVYWESIKNSAGREFASYEVGSEMALQLVYGQVEGHIFHDENTSGIWDADEPLISQSRVQTRSLPDTSGWKVQIYKLSDPDTVVQEVPVRNDHYQINDLSRQDAYGLRLLMNDLGDEWHITQTRDSQQPDDITIGTGNCFVEEERNASSQPVLPVLISGNVENDDAGNAKGNGIYNLGLVNQELNIRFFVSSKKGALNKDANNYSDANPYQIDGWGTAIPGILTVAVNNPDVRFVGWKKYEGNSTSNEAIARETAQIDTVGWDEDPNVDLIRIEDSTTMPYDNGSWFAVFQEFEPAEVQIKGRKVLQDQNGQSLTMNAKQFRFAFEYTGEHPNDLELPDSMEAENTEDGSFSFDTIRFKKAGTYTFKVREVQTSPNLYEYDQSEFEAEITVEKDDQNDTYQIASMRVIKAGQVVSEPVFTNILKDPAPAVVQVRGQKTLAGLKTTEDISFGQFTFEMTPDPSNDPEGWKSTLDLSDPIPVLDEGKMDLGDLIFTREGTYLFTLSETQGNLKGYTYDNQVYTLKVQVSLDDTANEYQAKMTILNGRGNQADELSFENSYQPASVDFTLPVLKEIHGEPQSASEFTFELTGQNHAPMPDSDQTRVNGAGTGQFDPITFTAPGTYRYTMREINSDQTGYTYDNQPVSIEVTVQDKDGQLHALASYSKAGKEIETPAFTNTYQPIASSLTLSVNKKVQGNPVHPESFSFRIEATSEDAPLPVATTISRNGAGDVDFAPIRFTQSGTYEYDVREIAGNQPGYSYDGQVTRVIVTVKDQAGTLIPETTFFANGQEVHQILFTNVYDPDDIQVPLTLTKKIDGQIPPTAADFEFTLKGVNDAPMPTDTRMSIHGVGSGSFESISFDRPGTYEYLITEVNGKLDHYTYDASENKAVVVIRDDNGVLKAEVTYIQNGVETDQLVFTNIYTPTPFLNLTIPVEKVVNGNFQSADTFRFVVEGSENAPVAEKNELTIFGQGCTNLVIPEIREPGDWSYTISEVEGNHPAYTYDSKKYRIDVHAEDQNGQITATAKLMLDGQSVDQIRFINTYMPKASQVIELPVQKVIAGNPTQPEIFTFLVKKSENAPELDQDLMTIEGSGSTVLALAETAQTGDWFYEISEEAGTNANYSYDSSVYRLDVHAADQDGQIVLNTKLTKNGLPAEDIVFTNQKTSSSPTPMHRNQPHLLPFRYEKLLKEIRPKQRPSVLQ